MLVSKCPTDWKKKLESGDYIGSEKKDGFWYELERTADGIIYLFSRSKSKKTEKSVYTGSTRNLTGLKACGLADGDKIIGIYETNGDYATEITKDGYSISFEMELVNTTG